VSCFVLTHLNLTEQCDQLESFCTEWPPESYNTVWSVSLIQCYRFMIEVTDITLPQCPHELWTDSSAFSISIEGCFPSGKEAWCMRIMPTSV
jgi:hypothetical protein